MMDALFAGIDGKATKPSRQVPRKSDAGVVPKKRANGRVTPSEHVEGRAAAKGNVAMTKQLRTQSRTHAALVHSRLGERARKRVGDWNNLFHLLKVPLLRDAFYALNKRAAPGIDKQSWQSYQEGLEENLKALETRLHTGAYVPKAARRVMIPKADGKERPLGIPSLEDKLVQRAVASLMEPIYEDVFHGFSYGFRPGRNAHDALNALHTALTTKKVNYILDADISAFFDTVNHDALLTMIRQRITDRRLLRLIAQWLKAGVMTDAGYAETETGTPQGGLISPLLANIYLHHVLDNAVHGWRQKHPESEIVIVRYADDFVIGARYEKDLVWLQDAIGERFARYDLKLHPDKTRILDFGRRASRKRARNGQPPCATFDFLGFTHISVAKKNGRARYEILRVTSRKKSNAKLRTLNDEMRKRRHDPVTEQYRWLKSVLRGHVNYYGLEGNDRVRIFWWKLQQLWMKSLQRRSQRARWNANAYARHRKRFPFPNVQALRKAKSKLKQP